MSRAPTLPCHNRWFEHEREVEVSGVVWARMNARTVADRTSIFGAFLAGAAVGSTYRGAGDFIPLCETHYVYGHVEDAHTGAEVAHEPHRASRGLLLGLADSALT